MINIKKNLPVLILVFFASFSPTIVGQITDTKSVVDYTVPKEYEIGGIKVTGTKFSDENALISISGLKVGDKIKIPGARIGEAIKALWKLKLFTDISIYKEKTIGDIVFLEIAVTERPRFSRHSFKGVKKSRHDDLNEEIGKFLVKGGIVTENVKVNAKNAILDYYKDKGYLDATVNVIELPDSSRVNAVRLVFDVDKKNRVKIQKITFSGNEHVKTRKLRRLLKNTKRKNRIFTSSKLIKKDYEEDKKAIITYYNTIGFKDARITSDSIWREEDGDLRIHINLAEGNRYYFRNIKWKGNSIYPTETLAKVLGINKGDVYNQELLDTRLKYSQDGRDISTLYMDDGYLFFNVTPEEVAIENDSIDLEMRIYEGPQATIDKVTISGNDRTHEHVIRRELRTRPGQKFSRSDIIRSQREIINLGYFNPEALGINTPVNPQRGTVDIEYKVEEKPSDQLELSAGWGGRGRGIIGTLGVTFNNFSLRNIFNKSAWNPLPQGDGQRLSVRVQSNGRYYRSSNFSFTEPWLGGKKPNSFSVSGYRTIISRFNNYFDADAKVIGRFVLNGVSISLGSRLKHPDDNFISSTALNIKNMILEDYAGAFRTDDGLIVNNGKFNNFSITQTIARSTISSPIFPMEGSSISLSVQLTPPYSLFSKKDYTDPSLTVEEKFKWLEYHKWKLNVDWYTTLVDKLVVKAGLKFGVIGFYNKDIGVSPFERFQLGGDGLNNQQFGYYTGTDIISLRGYDVNELSANLLNGVTASTPVYDKLTVELRYPLSLNPNSTIYVLAFAQGGNAWRYFKDFNPFDVKRSVGAGLRVFLPMFGVLGFDYAIGLDKPNATSFKDYGKFSIILGFEPE